jgi:hydrogenase-4 component B
MAARIAAVPGAWRDAAFVLALVGFGFKAGVVPLHIWLPEAHPAAPADGSGFLSGLVIKLGVFGIALFAFELEAGGPAWWGLVTMGLGALSAVLGILYGLMERDLKRFLAYSSIENIGVVLTALGGGMVFTAYGQQAIGTFLLLAGLYHVLNHGVYKTLLFLEAGVVEHTAGTRDMDALGGLIHRLRASAVISLIGTLGIAALPPLNGFVSEWLIFQGLFQGFRIDNHLVGILIVVAGANLALTGGLAIMAFGRAYGIPFLGMPRSRGAAAASERGQPIAGPGLLAVACVALGIGAPVVLAVLDRIVRATTGVEIHARLLVPKLTVIPAHTDFSGFSPTYLSVFLVCISVVPVLIYLAGRPRGATRTVPVWDGGILTYRARMQYTATTYANPIRVTFDELYRPEFHVERASDDPAGRSGPVHYRFRVLPIVERYLYAPVVRAVEWLADFVRPIQSGDVNLYLLYILLVVIVAYLIYTY